MIQKYTVTSGTLLSICRARDLSRVVVAMCRSLGDATCRQPDQRPGRARTRRPYSDPSEPYAHPRDGQPGHVIDGEVPSEVDGGEDRADQEHGEHARRPPDPEVRRRQHDDAGDGDVEAGEGGDLRE